jgi:hypothetical protein
MTKKPWQARVKKDLIIEVWEWLDCESIGAAELKAIATEVREHYGAGANDSPMAIARLLADEGAELRHPEIMALDVAWRSQDKYDAMFRNLLKFTDFRQAVQTLQQLENLRREFDRQQDQTGLRRLRELALKGKQRAAGIASKDNVEAGKRAEKAEIAHWFGVWLNAPALFTDWLALRLQSADFNEKFPPGEESSVSGQV